MQEVIKKFKFRDKAAVLYAPPLIEKALEKLGFETEIGPSAKSTNTLVFINDQAMYLDFLNHGLQNIEYDSVLWFAYPKGTSKVKTDINRDTIRETGKAFGITTVTAISIDETWSALRFRPIDRVGKK